MFNLCIWKTGAGFFLEADVKSSILLSTFAQDGRSQHMKAESSGQWKNVAKWDKIKNGNNTEVDTK